jgi:hypothetical protein
LEHAWKQKVEFPAETWFTRESLGYCTKVEKAGTKRKEGENRYKKRKGAYKRIVYPE